MQTSIILHRITHNKTAAIFLFSFLFLPGTFVHELAHFLMAKLLFVPTGSFSLKPELTGNDLRLGRVMIAKTDIIRRFLIGSAPFLAGTAIILLATFLLQQENTWNNPYFLVFVILIIFQIGNTMFSSKKDMESIVPLLILVTILTIVVYITGFRIKLDQNSIVFLNGVFKKASSLLLIPIGIDIVLISCLYLYKRVLQ